MAKVVSTLEELNELFTKNPSKAFIIDFHAVWCGPCKMIAPSFIAYAEKYSNVIAIKVDVDEAEDIAAKYKIEAMPTFIVIKNGEVVEKLQGANKDKLEAMFSKNN